MSGPSIRVGLLTPAKPPLGDIRMLVRFSRLAGLYNCVFWDHFQDFIPQCIWNEEFTWLAGEVPWCHEHYDYQVLLGYLAGIAGNMRLGVGVTEPLRRHPVLIAQAMMTLSHMTKQPPVLGMGAGERENTEPYGIPLEKPVSRLEEALQIIRMCFKSRGPFSFDGEFFQLKDAVIDLVPAEGKTPPIWIAAHGPRMLRLTGQYGDGWYSTTAHSADDYGDRLSTIRRHAREAGRDPDAIVPSLQTTIVIAPSDDEARKILKSRVVRFYSLLLPEEAFKHFGMPHPLGEGFRGFADIMPESLSASRINAAIDQVTPELIEQMTLWGSPDRLASKLRELGKAGLRHVDIGPISALASKRDMRYLPRGLFSLRRKLQ